MKIFLKIFTFLILGGGVIAALIWATINFSSAKINTETTEVPDIIFSQLSGEDILEKTSLPESITTSDIVVADYGRLASAYIKSLKDGDFHSLSSQVHINNKRLTIGDLEGVFSWYDPFSNYSLTDVNETFIATQITNGSLYFSRATDGSISLYSIDMVMDLEFLHEKTVMTKITIFPGMYIRFNPSMNFSLKNKDFLAILIDLDSQKNKNMEVNMGIGFADISSDNFRFVKGKNLMSIKKLFKKVRQYMYQQTRIIDDIKRYSSDKIYAFSQQDDTSIINPTKRVYRLLGELRMILSQGVNGEISIEDFSSKIQGILKSSQEFSLDDDVLKILEKFLIDSRFALFMTDGENLSRYQDLYNEIAKILNITPNTGKSQLFLRLSNDFSKHFIHPTNKVVDRYGSIATLLKSTLSQQGIEVHDHFDFSLYAFEILQAEGQGSTFNKKMIENKAFYDLYDFIIKASQDYAVKSGAKSGKRQTSLTQQMYIKMFDNLVRSVYQEYIMVIDDKLFIKDSYLKNNLPSISATHDSIGKLPESSISSVYLKMMGIYQDAIEASYEDARHEVKMQFETSLARLDAFLEIIKAGKYQEYLLSPYIVNKTSGLPEYDYTTKKLLRQTITSDDLGKGEDNENNQSNVQDESIADYISVVLGVKKEELNIQNIKKRKEKMYEVRMEYKGKKMAFIYISDRAAFGAIQFTIHEGTVKLSDVYKAREFKAILASIPAYETRIQTLLKENDNLKGESITLSLNQKSIQIGTKKFPLR